MNRFLPLTLVIAGLATACNPAAEEVQRQIQPTGVVATPLPRNTQSVVTPEATTALEFLEPPLEESSSAGVTVRLSHFEIGTDCLRVEVQVEGIKVPANAGPSFEPPGPVTDMALLEPGSDVPLNLTPIGGGGGGAPSPDGTVRVGMETIFRMNLSSAQRPLRLLVELSMDKSLGFTEPVVFAAEAAVAASQDCGLQGSTSP
jgi:hypothetical protein